MKQTENIYYLFIYGACDIQYFRDYLLFVRYNRLFLIVVDFAGGKRGYYVSFCRVTNRSLKKL